MAGSRERSFGSDDAPYLPDRYHRLVSAKKRRRILRKIGIACSAIVAVAILFVVFFGSYFGSFQGSLPEIPPLPESPAASVTMVPLANTTPSATPAIVIGSGLSSESDAGLLPPATAIDLIRFEFPAETFTITRMNLTDVSGKNVYEFELSPLTGTKMTSRITAGIDAITGDPYTPGQESAKFSEEQVKQIATRFFLPLKADQVRARYNILPGSESAWDFVFIRDHVPVLSGTLDPETGSITHFSRNLSYEGRPKEPILSLSAAQKSADRAIFTWNGDVPVSLGSGRYEPANDSGIPVAGRYLFRYNRMVHDIPCDNDGFFIAVDSASGDIIEYERTWYNPENAFSVTSDPLVTKREATFAVLQNASERSPDSVQGIQVLSAQLLWKDLHTPGQTPRPGTIPLAWKVIFDDQTLRSKEQSLQAAGWVDAQTGTVISMDYSR
jgi:hypothetical protein